ncbi:unnamed protein product [Schistosoma turkestanicum]|nr:unnamed protein product [Schistosoma turkestanicum]
MKLMTLIFMMCVIAISPQSHDTVHEEQRNADLEIHSEISKSHHKTNSTSKDSQTNRKGKLGIERSSMFGRSRSRYKYKNRKHIVARGKFRSRGIGRYGIVSSETTNFEIEGKFDRYGRKRPTKSKFKTRGKEKKYSKKIVDNQFDIKGGLIQERKHRHAGDYQANGSHIYIDVGAKTESGSSMNTKEGKGSTRNTVNNGTFEAELLTSDRQSGERRK